MATIRKEIRFAASAETVWDAVRDIGALHARLVPGFVTDTKMEDGARIVTFANGMVAREVIVANDDGLRRLAWSATGEWLSHHNASAEVVPDGAGCRLIWTADLLPDAMAPAIAGMMDAGLSAMRKALRS